MVSLPQPALLLKDNEFFQVRNLIRCALQIGERQMNFREISARGYGLAVLSTHIPPIQNDHRSLA